MLGSSEITTTSNLTWLVLGLTISFFAMMYIVLGLNTKKSLPGPPGNNTIEVVKNLPRFLDWLLEQTRLYGGQDGLGSWAFKVCKASI